MATTAAGHPANRVSDTELVRAYRAGSEPAARDLVQRHASAIARHLYSSGADRSDIDDLMQETFFRAFRRLDSWRGEAGLRGWLCVIAGNVLRDAVRRRPKSVALSLSDHDVPAPENPAADVITADTAEQLRQAIGLLPRLQREVFLLRTQQGLEYAAIAVALGTTIGAARVHYHGAVRQLKAVIA